MKKILVVMALVSVVFASCQKDEETVPTAKTEQAVMGGEKRDMGGWD